VKLTTHLHIVPRSKKEWRYTFTPSVRFMAWCSVKKSAGTNLPLSKKFCVICSLERDTQSSFSVLRSTFKVTEVISCLIIKSGLRLHENPILLKATMYKTNVLLAEEVNT